MRYAKYCMLAAGVVAAMFTATAQVSFVGNDRPVYQEGQSSHTGSMAIYVLHSAQGVSMTYEASSTDDVTWYKFGAQGAIDMIELGGIVKNGTTTTMPQVEANQGYVIMEGVNPTYVWVADYSTSPLQLVSATVDPESDCGTALINVEGSGNPIKYCDINGVEKTLDRDIKVTYNTREWIADDYHWAETQVIESESQFKSVIAVPAPYCGTTFTVSGDKFLRFWKEEKSVSTLNYSPRAINVMVRAEQEERNNDNEQTTGGGVLGGSAPAKITFTAYCTDAVTFKEWQVSDNQEFTNILMNFSQDEVEYTFEDAGTTYWRFYGANSDGSCEYYGDPITVSIGESVLVCPNIFSPGTTPEVNDVWKVSYKSIIDFHCWIYNRWGNLIKEFTDPSDGWDGTYNGKQVSAGVYFYVIQATGSDGKKYKLSGDINILRYERRDYGGGTVPEEPR